MKKDYKPETLRLAAGLCGIVMNESTADLLLEIMKSMDKHGDKFSIFHAVKLNAAIADKYRPKIKITTDATKSSSEREDSPQVA